jgi:hypothetical protein
METITFKVEDAIAAELESRAQATNGSSRHTIARQMVLAVLTDANHFQVMNRLELQSGEHSEIKHLLATMTVALLVQGGVDRTDAERWVRRVFFGEQLSNGNDGRSDQDE